MTDPDKPVEVTQEDRDAAAEYMRLFPELRLPEAFARHRTRATNEAGESRGKVTFVRCKSCGGEFDEGEWDADSRCPECEMPKEADGKRAALLSVEGRSKSATITRLAREMADKACSEAQLIGGYDIGIFERAFAVALATPPANEAGEGDAWEQVGFLQESLRQAEAQIASINAYLPKYLATIAENAKLRAAVNASARQDGVREAAQELLDGLASTYKARNGREIGIEADDGEKCWIVHSDLVTGLRAALSDSSTRATNEVEQAYRDGYSHGSNGLPPLTPPRATNEEGEARLRDDVPADVRRLVIAAREIAFNDWDGDSEEWAVARKELDDASEAFASRVPWDDEPATPSTDAGGA
ncbi:MAG TPA: hypothetical protein PKD48_02100 [Sphingopyxis sp.]|nr:hypothetical protein [Sphingopyxis sp.]